MYITATRRPLLTLDRSNTFSQAGGTNTTRKQEKDAAAAAAAAAGKKGAGEEGDEGDGACCLIFRGPREVSPWFRSWCDDCWENVLEDSWKILKGHCSASIDIPSRPACRPA